MVCCGIYKFTNKKNGKVYIGQSKNIWYRYGLHYTVAYTSNQEKLSPIDEALYTDPEDFEFEIVEFCKEEELNKKEAEWIEYCDSERNGYNVVSSRKVYQFDLNGTLVAIHYGYADAAKAINRPQGTGNIYKCCQNQQRTAYGYKWSLTPTLGEEPPKSKREKHSTKKRAVLQIDKEGIVVNKFSSCAEAARHMGVTSGAICGVCNGRSKSCKGYSWKYSEEE